ncbi:quinone oxidoreductase [Dentipellis sp. KUC8613]|nr:quinone oxidoreductase [Dentipellis sp. KUC8613]
MTQMRAVLIKDGKGPIENLFVGDTARPTAGANQVLVQIKAFGLNRMDVYQRLGRYPVPAGASEILGVEFAGTIAELGPGVTGWAVGDAVLGLAGGGAYAEYIALPAANLMRKPSHLSWTEAASIPENFLTAFQALVLCADIKEGDNVLIHAGASGVGIAAIQLARKYGAKTVTATASTKEKLDWLLSIPNGATHVANYKTQDFSEEVKKTTGGKGVDVVIDFVGQSHWKKNIDSMGLDARMTILATLSGAEVPSFDLSPILYKRLRIQGSTLRSRSPEYQADLIARFAKDILGDITGATGNGPIRVHIHKVYPWTDIQAATTEMEANKNSGKIIAEIV